MGSILHGHKKRRALVAPLSNISFVIYFTRKEKGEVRSMWVSNLKVCESFFRSPLSVCLSVCLSLALSRSLDHLRLSLSKCRQKGRQTGRQAGRQIDIYGMVWLVIDRLRWCSGYVIGQWAGRYWVRISVPARP